MRDVIFLIEHLMLVQARHLWTSSFNVHVDRVNIACVKMGAQHTPEGARPLA